MHRKNPPEAALKTGLGKRSVRPPRRLRLFGRKAGGFLSMALNRPVSCNVVLYSFNRSSFQYCPSIHGLSLLR